MPDTEPVVTADNPDGTLGNKTASPANADNEGKLIMGKFKTTDELGKAYEESEKAMRKAQQEASDARKQAESLLEKANLTETLSRLNEHLQPKTKEPDWGAFMEELAELSRTDPGEATKKLTTAVGSWIAEGENKSKSYADTLMKEMKAELKQLREGVEKDEFYRENQSTIDGLVSDGMSLSKAKDWAKKFAKTEMPSRVEPPSSLGGGRITDRSAPKDVFTPDEKSTMRNSYLEMGLNAEQANAAIAQLELEYKARGAK